MYQTLFQTLSPTDIILTVNRRLAIFLLEQYAALRISNVDLIPDILPIHSWLERCWLEGITLGHCQPNILLNSSQEHLLWEQIIKESSLGTTLLLRPATTAQIANQAWHLVKQWGIDYTQSSFAATENSNVWQTWAKEFQSICLKQSWLDSQTLPDWLQQQFMAEHIPLPKKLILVGFDEIIPQYQQFFQSLSSKGTVISSINYEEQVSELQITSKELATCTSSRAPQILALPNPETELKTMARWAHTLWLQGINSIGCIIPNLSEIREQVLTTFMEVFTPEALLPGYHTTNLPFNISSGIPLKNFGLISAALTILNLTNKVELKYFKNLLHSPYIGQAEQEMSSRARLDSQLCSLGELTLPLQQIQIFAKKLGLQQLAKQLGDYNQLQPSKAQFSPQQWAQFFTKQLLVFDWPGERALNSTEYQLLESWSNLLTTFSQLTLVAPTLNHREALHYLTYLAWQQSFQPKTPSAPVQILGILEAGGLQFQHLWVMGLHDKSWPANPNPNPFIPHQIQHQYHISHASNERELEYCRILTHRLTQTAPQVIFSYPQTLIEETVGISPILPAGKQITLEHLQLPHYRSYAEMIFESSMQESLIDDNAPPLLQGGKIAGGTAIFKDQAACPFRAFANFRLHTKTLNVPEAGLTPQERGSLLHQTLEILWNTLQNQHNLLRHSQEELNSIISETLEQTFNKLLVKRPTTLHERFVFIEKKRLHKILNDWLMLEKKRAPFTVVATEQTKSFFFDNLEFLLKTDRIDQTTEGEQLVIDYKTGIFSPSDWLGERPDEPQLPLYCITSKPTITGLLFAQIRSDTKLFRGIVAHDQHHIPGANTPQSLKDPALSSWNDLVHYWQKVLVQLAQQFQQGYAKVDPKNGDKSCQFCALQVLCRIHEQN